MSTLIFDLHTFWHPGSGRGDGPTTDAAVLRSPAGLPYLPGRTVKGLVRDACTLAVVAGVLDRERVEEWFGSVVADANPDNRERKLEEARYRTTQGRLRFESATLGPEWEAWATSCRADLDGGAAGRRGAPRRDWQRVRTADRERGPRSESA